MNRKLLTGTALALAAVSAIGIATFTTAAFKATLG